MSVSEDAVGMILPEGLGSAPGNLLCLALGAVFIEFSGILTGLADMGSGQLLQGSFVLVVGQGGIENINNVQLGHSGGHGTAAENGFVGGGV